MRIIFSKDRPAQLDLLLRSLERYAPDPSELTYVIACGSNGDFARAYLHLHSELLGSRQVVSMHMENDPHPFDAILRTGLRHDTVTFFCDDDVLFRAPDTDPRRAILKYDEFLTWSWRLSARAMKPLARWWHWRSLPRTDHGYPGSIDGHTFRTADVLEMIAGDPVENPTMLERALALGCEKLAGRRPLMAAWPEQVLVGVPVNRVSDSSGCPNGQVYPQPVDELNRRFLAGERISLDRLDFSAVTGCHHELQYVWE